MDKKNINLSVPAQVVPLEDNNFTSLFENEHVTKCKLKIFYIGETGDGRVFTKDFSEKLLESLPYTPVVGYYDEEADDFKAHSSKQYMFGHVPLDASISFEEENDKTYAVTDIILFTERHDVGEIASKVIGSQHSLELNPDTVKYQITRDESGKMKSLVFLDGDFYGLSIVGDAEKPAFSGSEFFTEMTEQEQTGFKQSLMAFIDSVKNYYSNEGGVEMDKFLEQLVENLGDNMAEFIKQTYAEKQQSVYSALYKEYGEYSCYIAQMDDSTVVYYLFETGGYMRANYSSNEDGVELSEAVEVKARFLTPDEIESTFTQSTVEEEGSEEDEDTDDLTGEGDNNFQENEGEETDNDETQEDDETSFTEGEGAEGETTTGEETEKATKPTELTKEEEAAQLALQEEERKELENYRRLAKKEQISNYKKFLSEDDFKSLNDRVDEFDKKALETELKIKAADFLMASQEDEDEEGNEVGQDVFNIMGKNDDDIEDKNQSRVDFLIKKYK